MAGLTFKSTSIALKILEKIFDSNLQVTGLENIPDAPCLFVANHFTRSETFILPYMLHHEAKKKVRSLADEGLFVGSLGSYLTSMGTLATSDPKRNETIISDLISGKNDWLIYPEGLMVKNKHITKSCNYILHLPKGMQSVKTGSAVLAIKAELLRQEYYQLQETRNKERISEFRSKYYLAEDDVVTSKHLHIVPITIDYYPIRPGSNSIYRLSKLFIKNLPDRVLEELEIEGNLLTNSAVKVHIGQSVNVWQFIKRNKQIVEKIPFIKPQTKKNLIISHYRHKLTKHFMDQVYGNLIINLDHIFVASLFYHDGKRINKEYFKNLIYENSLSIAALEKYRLHDSICEKLEMIFLEQDNIYYDSIFKLAIEQAIITKSGDDYIINHCKLNDVSDFHHARVNNSLRIFVNELLKFPDLINIFEKNAQLTRIKLRKKIRNDLIVNDQKAHYDDYHKYFSREESKPFEYGMPYFLEAKNSDIGVILSHGYKAAPEEVKILAEYLHSKNISVYVVRLKGHGTAPDNMKDISWQEWYHSFYLGYAILKKTAKHVVAAGFSTGGLLALLLAAKKPDDIAAVISINSALKLNDIRVNMVPTIHFWNELLGKANIEKGKKEYIIDEPENPKINYAKNYLSAVNELSDLMGETNKNLKNITSPTLIIQATGDPVVNPKSADIIYKKIAATQKELVTPELFNHVIIKYQNEELFSKITNFIYKVTKNDQS